MESAPLSASQLQQQAQRQRQQLQASPAGQPAQQQEQQDLLETLRQLTSKVQRLESELGEAHCGDLNTLRRAHRTLCQHTYALLGESKDVEAEIRALEYEVFSPDHIANELGVAGLVAAGAYGVAKVLRWGGLQLRGVARGVWALGATFILFHLATGTVSRLARFAVNNEARKRRLLAQWHLLASRIEVMAALCQTGPTARDAWSASPAKRALSPATSQGRSAGAGGGGGGSAGAQQRLHDRSPLSAMSSNTSHAGAEPDVRDTWAQLVAQPRGPPSTGASSQGSAAERLGDVSGAALPAAQAPPVVYVRGGGGGSNAGGVGGSGGSGAALSGRELAAAILALSGDGRRESGSGAAAGNGAAAAAAALDAERQAVVRQGRRKA